MKIEMLTSMGDRLGRAYRPGRRYEMDDDEAGKLIRAGYAKAVATDAVAAASALKSLGGGLLVTKATDQALIVAAKAAKVPVKRERANARSHA